MTQLIEKQRVPSVPSVPNDVLGQMGQATVPSVPSVPHTFRCGDKWDKETGRARDEQDESSNRAVWVETVWLPVATVSEANGRDHWAVKGKRARKQRTCARLLCPKAELPAVIKLTRLSRGRLDDDNLRGALKAVRDGIADAFGVPDNDPRLRFEYDQAPRGDKLQGSVLVEVRAG